MRWIYMDAVDIHGCGGYTWMRWIYMDAVDEEDMEDV
jgi:hypothetical protein